MIRIGDFKPEQKYVDAVTEVIKSGRITEGPKVAELEKVMAKYLDVKNAILVTNGTIALQLVSLYLRSKEKDNELNVVVPALTFPATINAFSGSGHPVAMCDIGEDLLIDINTIDTSDKQETDIIVPVHLMGYPANMDVIMAEAKKYDWTVIEDACFTANTLIPTKNGVKKIKDIKKEDKLFGYDEKNKCFKETIVKDIGNRLSSYKDMLVIKLDNGQLIRCTKEHPFFVKEKWKRADKLNINDEIWHSSTGEYLTWKRDHKLTPKGRKILSDRMIRNNPSYNSETVRKSASNRVHTKTRIEKIVEQVANNNGLPIEYIGDASMWIGSKETGYKNPDFIIKDDKKVIEVYDTTFKYVSGFREDKWKKERSDFFNKFGYKTYFIGLSGWVNKQERTKLKNELNKIVHNGHKIVSIIPLKKQYINRYNNNKKEPIDKIRVYNLHCEPFNNFTLTGGTLVHNCEAFGAEHDGKKVGTIGDFGCFSFYVSHNITAGELGMIVTNNNEAAKVLRSMKNHGRVGSGMLFNHEYVGYNAKTTEFSAALGLENMKDVDTSLKIRKDNNAPQSAANNPAVIILEPINSAVKKARAAISDTPAQNPSPISKRLKTFITPIIHKKDMR